MHYSITFPADFQHMPSLRDMVASVALHQGFSKQTAEHAKSIIDELGNNAIEHGSQATSQVEVRIDSSEKELKITVLDQGHGNKMKAEDIQAKLAAGTPFENGRGRGLSMIVKGFSDQFTLEDRKDGGIIACAILH